MTWTAKSSRRLLPAALAVLAVIAWAGSVLGTEAVTASAKAPAVAAAAKPATAPAAQAQQPVAAGEAGMRAYIDPETGLLTSTPPAGVQVEATVAEPAPVLQEEVLPDGSVMMDLKGTLQDYFILQLDANGQKVVRCVEDPKAALATPPPAPKREDR